MEDDHWLFGKLTSFDCEDVGEFLLVCDLVLLKSS